MRERERERERERNRQRERDRDREREPYHDGCTVLRYCLQFPDLSHK